MSVTEKLSSFLVATMYDDLPAGSVERAKKLVLDFVRSSFGGCGTRVSNIVTDHIKEIGARAEASVIGKKFRTTASYAAYANAVLDHALELEAVGTIGPNTAQDIAVALSLGEKAGLPGRKVLEGIVLGYELQARAWNGAIAAASTKGWVLPFNYVGAVATASKMLDLDVNQTRAALGICLSESSGMNCQAGSMAHYFAFAYPAYSGIEAAEYAKLGVDSNAEILETAQGFCDQFAGEGEADFERMTEGLGDTYWITPPATYIKRYPCCYLSHSAVCAVLDLLEQNNITYEDIEGVQVEANKAILSWLRYSDPRTPDEARFSFEHILGAAIRDRQVSGQSFTESTISSQKYREARAKITVVSHLEWPASLAGSRTPVTIKLKSGEMYCKEVEKPVEATTEELLKAYREMSEPFLSRELAERSVEMIMGLEKVENVAQLMDILRAGGDK